MKDISPACCTTTDQSAVGRLPAWATRNRLMMAGGAVVIGGLVFNWGWLTAIGVAPILLAVAPCGIMCVLGLCMMGKKKTAAAPPVIPTNTSAE